MARYEMTTKEKWDEFSPILVTLLAVATLVLFTLWRGAVDELELRTGILEGNVITQVEVKACVVNMLALRLDEGEIRTGDDLENAWFAEAEHSCALSKGTTAAFPETYESFDSPPG